MNWKIEPTTSKNVAEFVTYTKGNNSLVHATYYRWATVYVTSETKPIFGYSEEEQGTKFEHYDNDLDHDLCDGYYSCIVDFSKEMRKKVKEDLRDFVDDHGIGELENDGWELLESVIWIYGTLQINEC
jgi:hypothetical protein